MAVGAFVSGKVFANILSGPHPNLGSGRKQNPFVYGRYSCRFSPAARGTLRRGPGRGPGRLRAETASAATAQEPPPRLSAPPPDPRRRAGCRCSVPRSVSCPAADPVRFFAAGFLCLPAACPPSCRRAFRAFFSPPPYEPGNFFRLLCVNRIVFVNLHDI